LAAQEHQVVGMITERTDRPVEIVGVTTLGEVSPEPLTQIGGSDVGAGGAAQGLCHEHSKAARIGEAADANAAAVPVAAG
jgi:hypothetical protein